MAVLFMGGMFSTWGQAPAAKAELPTIAYFHHSYSVYTIDPKVADIRLYWKDASGHLLQNFTALNAQVESEGNQLLFAANAGMFQPDFSPVGLLVINGQEISPLNLRDAAGNFYLKPNGVFVVTDQGKAEIMESSSYATFLPRVLWATQSGPLIVHHGEIHPDLIAGSTNLAIRSGVGVREDGTVVMALSKTQVNFYDFASFFRDRMKCPNALYLDGTISAFCLPGQVQRPALHLFGPMIGVVARK
jgi:uncharacterized protein YigE (DUF2233 family)